jgi:hypothetical protein
MGFSRAKARSAGAGFSFVLAASRLGARFRTNLPCELIEGVMAGTDTDPAVCSRILREVEAAAAPECVAYLAGAAHDGTYSRLHGTLRISQATPEWLTVLQAVFRRLGSRSWIYREGARRVWVIESTCRITVPSASLPFVRGQRTGAGISIPRVACHGVQIAGSTSR